MKKDKKTQNRKADADAKAQKESPVQLSLGQYERRFETAERTCAAIAVILGLLGSAMAALSAHRILIAWTFGLAVIAAVLALLFWYTDNQLHRQNPLVIQPESEPPSPTTPEPTSATPVAETPRPEEPINFTPSQIMNKIELRIVKILVRISVPLKGNERLPLTETDKKFRVKGLIDLINPLTIDLRNATFEPAR